jgi:hypothetical protein
LEQASQAQLHRALSCEAEDEYNIQLQLKKILKIFKKVLYLHIFNISISKMLNYLFQKHSIKKLNWRFFRKQPKKKFQDFI